MKEPINIGQNYAIANLLKQHGVQVVSEEGNTYWFLPMWLEQLPGNFEFNVIEQEDVPEDLAVMITKSRLGGENLKIPKL